MEMDLEEVRVRLLDAFRSGRLSLDLKGVVLGFARAMKSKNGPSVKQIEIARKLLREIRYHDGAEPVDLIDYDDNEDDNETCQEQANDDYEEF